MAAIEECNKVTMHISRIAEKSLYITYYDWLFERRKTSFRVTLSRTIFHRTFSFYHQSPFVWTNIGLFYVLTNVLVVVYGSIHQSIHIIFGSLQIIFCWHEHSQIDKNHYWFLNLVDKMNNLQWRIRICIRYMIFSLLDFHKMYKRTAVIHLCIL